MLCVETNCAHKYTHMHERAHTHAHMAWVLLSFSCSQQRDGYTLIAMRRFEIEWNIHCTRSKREQCYTAVVAFPCCARCTIAASTIPIQNGQNKWIWCDTKRSDRHGYNAQHTKGIHLMDWRRAIWPTCANAGCEVVAYCGRIEHRIDTIRSRQFTQSNRRLSEMTKGEWHEM